MGSSGGKVSFALKGAVVIVPMCYDVEHHWWPHSDHRSARRCQRRVRLASGSKSYNRTSSRGQAGYASMLTFQSRGGFYQRTDDCLRTGSHGWLRRAVTKKVRGTSGSEHGMTGNSQRPNCAPSSPGSTTLACQPRSAKKASGLSMLEIQAAPPWRAVRSRSAFEVKSASPYF